MKSIVSRASYNELISKVHHLSYEGKTGTVFIGSENGHFVRFVLVEGRITSIVFDAKYYDYDAIPHIQQINHGKLHFIEDVFESYDDCDDSLPGTEKIFQQLSLSQEDIKKAKAVKKPLPSTSIPEKVTPDFSKNVEHIKKVLATHIGPIAIMVCEEYLKKVGSISTLNDIFAMIDAMALEIENIEKKQTFKEEALGKQLKKKMGITLTHIK